MAVPSAERDDPGGASARPEPGDVSWIAPDLREHLPDEAALPEQGMRAAVTLLRNPDASGAFVAADLNRSREPGIIRETLERLLAYPREERQPRDAKSPTVPHYSTGVSGLAGRTANSFADLSPKQRGVVEVVAQADDILNRVDGGGSIFIRRENPALQGGRESPHGRFRCSMAVLGGNRPKTTKITPNQRGRTSTPPQDRSNGGVALPAPPSVCKRKFPPPAGFGLWEAPSFTTGRRSRRGRQRYRARIRRLCESRSGLLHRERPAQGGTTTR